ncbi:MAG: histone [Promethearchaeota archaeon]
MAKKAKAKPKPAASKPKPAAKVSAPSFIAKAPIRRLMRNQGANLVAENAVLVLINYLEKYGAEVTKAAMDAASKDKRKRVTADDVEAGAKA